MPRSLDARGMIGGQVRRSTKESKKALQTTKSTPKGIQCLRMDGSSPGVKFFGNAPVAARLLLVCRIYGNSFAPRFDGHAGPPWGARTRKTEDAGLVTAGWREAEDGFLPGGQMVAKVRQL